MLKSPGNCCSTLIPEPIGVRQPEPSSSVPQHGVVRVSQASLASEFIEMVQAAADRVLRLATEKPSRWVSVLPKLGRMPPESRQQALDALGTLDPGTSVPTSDWRSGRRSIALFGGIENTRTPNGLWTKRR